MIKLGYTARLVGWHVAVIILILGVTTFALDWTVRRVVLDQFDAALLHAAQTEAAEIVDEGQTTRVHAPTTKRVRRLLWSFNPVVQVIDLENGGAVPRPGLNTARPLPTPAPLLDRLQRGKTAFYTVSDRDRLRMVAVPAQHQGRRYAVQVAQSLREVHFLLNRLRLLFAAASVAVLIALVLT